MCLMSRRWAGKRMRGRARLHVETTIKARSAWIFTSSKLLLMKPIQVWVWFHVLMTPGQNG